MSWNKPITIVEDKGYPTRSGSFEMLRASLKDADADS